MERVLVVDDSAVDRVLISGLLSAAQFEVEPAEGGDEALEKLAAGDFSLVVTDLHMPGRNGLDVAAWVRLRRPEIPVILVTSRGSEEVAVEALARGAAGYVPKSQLAAKLVDVCRQALVLARADLSYTRLIGSLVGCRFQFELENDLDAIDPLVNMVQEMTAGMHLTDAAGRIQIGAALRETLLNALVRGNLQLGFSELADPREAFCDPQIAASIARRAAEQPYAGRRIRVSVEIDRDEARFGVADEGPGFDYNSAIAAASNAELAVAGEAGRGLVLMHAFCDEVRYEPPGNIAVLVKRREERGQHPDSAPRVD